MIHSRIAFAAACGLSALLSCYPAAATAKPIAAGTPVANEKAKKSKTPIVTLTANAASVVAGDNLTLNWSSVNATSCSASGAWSGTRPISGSAVIAGLESDASFTLTCNGKKGSATQSVMVAVTAPPAPEVSISQSSEQVVRGQTVLLTWTSRHATGCTASGNWSGSRATAGQETVGPLDANSTFVLTCSGRGGTRSTRADIEVVPPPVFTLGSVTNRMIAGPPALTNQWGLSQFADIDGDGRDDLLIAGAYYPSEGTQPAPRPGYLALNKREGFRAATRDEFPADLFTAVHAREFAFVDFNKDGVKDLFVADHGYDAPPYPGFRNQLFLSQAGQPRWIDATRALPGDSDFTHSVATGDINGDGNVDIVAGNFGFQSAYILLGDGAGGFQKRTDLLPNLPISVASCLLADLDGDGLPELLLGTNRQNSMTQVLWNRSGSYATAEPTKLGEAVAFGPDWMVMDMQPTDLNNDGRLDIVVVYQAHVWNGGWQFQFLVNDGNRGFRDETARYLPYPAVVSSEIPTEAKPQTWVPFITLRDLNDDGRTDVSITCQSWGGRIAADDCPVVLLNQADGTFAPVTIGMLRAAGVPDFFFWGVNFVANGPGANGEFANYYLAPDGRTGINVVPVTFRR